LDEIHKGVCGNHASSRTLVSKAFRRAFYWPTTLGDAEELVRRCQGCQYFAKKQHVPAYKLTIPPTWPFACWRLDMIGVTEPPKIIPYYRLSRSTWPLSNNKELLSRFRRVKPGKSHTTGSLICAKPTRRRDQSTTLHYIRRFTSLTLLQTRFLYIKVNMNRV
jgi:hypothetical protein